MTTKTTALEFLAVLAAVSVLGGCAGSGNDRTGGAGGGGAGGNGGGGAGGANGGGGGASAGGAGGGGGASGGGGAGGAAAQDGGVDSPAGGNGPCDAPGIIVCDDFENGIQSFRVPTGGQVTIDMTKHHSGTNSITTTGTNAPSNHISTPPGTVFPSNSFYVRAWVYFEKATTSMSGHVDYIVGAVAEDNSGVEVRLGSSVNLKGLEMLDMNEQPPDRTQFSNGDVNGVGGGTTTPGVALDAARWYCLEAFFNGDGQNSAFQAWVDETEVTGLHVTDWGGQATGTARAWAPMYNLVKVGAQNFSGSVGNVWYDDVAVGTQRIHCNP